MNTITMEDVQNESTDDKLKDGCTTFKGDPKKASSIAVEQTMKLNPRANQDSAMPDSRSIVDTTNALKRRLSSSSLLNQGSPLKINKGTGNSKIDIDNKQNIQVQDQEQENDQQQT